MQVKVRAQPQDGKANAAVAALLAKVLDVPKSRVAIVAGQKDRLKLAKAVGDPKLLAQAITDQLERCAS